MDQTCCPDSKFICLTLRLLNEICGVEMLGTRVFIGILLSLSLFSCNVKKKEKRRLGDRGDHPNLTKPQDDNSNNGNTSIVGTWVGQCVSVQDPGDGSYISDRVTVEFSELKSVKLSLQTFAGKDCQDKDKWHTKILTSTYNADADSDLGNGIKNLDTEIIKLSVIPHTDNEASNLNDEVTCGVKTWKKDVEMDVTNLSCDEEDSPLKKGDKGYDIYKISGDTIQFGINSLEVDNESNVGRTPQTRPSELSPAVYNRE